MRKLAKRTDGLRQSGIRAITRLVDEVNGINLGQGICDMPVPDPIKEAAHRAVENDRSIYTPFEGIPSLQHRVFDKITSYNRIPLPGPENVMISAGSTGAFVTAIFSLLDEGDEIILFEPYYGYHKGIIGLTGAQIRTVRLHPPDWEIDFDELERAITSRTKSIVVNTPTNPTGKVWTRAELERLVEILEGHDLWAITDEIYEYMVYDGAEHVSLASLPGAFERTISVSGFSKTFNMTGWRLGYASGPADIIEKMGLLNDLFYICAPSPLQYALVSAFDLSQSYFDNLQADYDKKRQMLSAALHRTGFDFAPPSGSYYLFASFEGLSGHVEGYDNDSEACETLIRSTGVASIPGRAFFADPDPGRYYLRFCYAKEFDVLEEACSQLAENGPSV